MIYKRLMQCFLLYVLSNLTGCLSIYKETSYVSGSHVVYEAESSNDPETLLSAVMIGWSKIPNAEPLTPLYHWEHLGTISWNRAAAFPDELHINIHVTSGDKKASKIYIDALYFHGGTRPASVYAISPEAKARLELLILTIEKQESVSTFESTKGLEVLR